MCIVTTWKLKLYWLWVGHEVFATFKYKMDPSTKQIINKYLSFQADEFSLSWVYCIV